MAERLKLTPTETYVTLVNEILTDPINMRGYGHYSEQIARILHGSAWKWWFHPDMNPLRAEDIMDHVQKGQLLMGTVDKILETLKYERRIEAVRFRFGLDDGMIHTLEEVGRLSDVGRSRAGQILDREMRRLRHPSRSRELRQFLPENS